MHRTFEIVLETEKADELCRKIVENENVINVSILRGASVKPAGDIVTVHLLSRGADHVLQAVKKTDRVWLCPASACSLR
jgi:Na+/serine symporter